MEDIIRIYILYGHTEEVQECVIAYLHTLYDLAKDLNEEAISTMYKLDTINNLLYNNKDVMTLCLAIKQHHLMNMINW